MIAKLVDGKQAKIIELGCGTGDISGPYAAEHDVVGIECSPSCAAEAKKRFRWMKVRTESIAEARPEPCDVLILCEVLEHLAEPMELVKKWAPLAKAMVISHPLDEQILRNQGIDLSAGEHQWAFNGADLNAWFTENNFEVCDVQTFPMGSYTDILAYGVRR
jgi:2-polyprenyl-3-methyl-5-hydroxy-6-metoxy-1,4-benzoquinol methylase